VGLSTGRCPSMSNGPQSGRLRISFETSLLKGKLPPLPVHELRAERRRGEGYRLLLSWLGQKHAELLLDRLLQSSVRLDSLEQLGDAREPGSVRVRAVISLNASEESREALAKICLANGGSLMAARARVAARVPVRGSFDVAMSEDEIASWLKGHGITVEKVQRVKRADGLLLTHCIILISPRDLPKLPQQPPPQRKKIDPNWHKRPPEAECVCFRCYRKGHVARACKAEQACHNCGSTQHAAKACDAQRLDCPVCHGEHAATRCPGLKRWVPIQLDQPQSELAVAHKARPASAALPKLNSWSHFPPLPSTAPVAAALERIDNRLTAVQSAMLPLAQAAASLAQLVSKLTPGGPHALSDYPSAGNLSSLCSLLRSALDALADLATSVESPLGPRREHKRATDSKEAATGVRVAASPSAASTISAPANSSSTASRVPEPVPDGSGSMAAAAASEESDTLAAAASPSSTTSSDPSDELESVAAVEVDETDVVVATTAPPEAGAALTDLTATAAAEKAVTSLAGSQSRHPVSGPASSAPYNLRRPTGRTTEQTSSSFTAAAAAEEKSAGGKSKPKPRKKGAK